MLYVAVAVVQTKTKRNKGKFRYVIVTANREWIYSDFFETSDKAIAAGLEAYKAIALFT